MSNLNLTRDEGVWEQWGRELQVFNPYQFPSYHHFDSQQIMETKYVTVGTADPFG